MSASYQFTRTSKSIIRLNYMHHIAKQICGFLLEPRIPVSSPSLKIADIGAGTGIWAIDALASLPPSTEIVAFDNSRQQFFPKEYLPHGLDICIHDAFVPFPEKYHGYFDVVAIKFWKTLVNEDNIALFVSNVMQILKPGGWIQWLEFETGGSSVWKPRSKIPTPWIDKFWKVPHKTEGSPSWNWASSQTDFETKGLADVDTVRIKWDAEKWMPYWMHFHYLTLEDKLEQMEKEGQTEGLERLEELRGNVFWEIGLGYGVVQDGIVMVGRKTG